MLSLLNYMSDLYDSFQKRWNNYRECARKVERGKECKRNYLYEHFLQDDHHGFLSNAQVILIDKT